MRHPALFPILAALPLMACEALSDHPIAPELPEPPAFAKAVSNGSGQIAFVSDRDGNIDIHVMNADGTGVTNLTNGGGSNFNPAWSPNGKQIAFVSERDGNREIYVMNANGTALTRLTRNPARDSDPAWTGRQIGFASNRDGNNSDIYIMNEDGTALTRLTNTPASDFSPAWSK